VNDKDMAAMVVICFFTFLAGLLVGSLLCEEQLQPVHVNNTLLGPSVRVITMVPQTCDTGDVVFLSEGYVGYPIGLYVCTTKNNWAQLPAR